LPKSWTTYIDIIDKKHQWNYQDFLKGEKMVFVNKRYPYENLFSNQKVIALRCADGTYFNGNVNGQPYSKRDSNYGLSVRCLKD
jgi:hypothetical protein